MQLVGIRGVGPRFAAHPRYRLGIEPTDVSGGLWRQPTAGHYRLSAAFFERGVIEICVGPGRQHFESKRRGLGQIARDDTDFACFEPGEDLRQAVDVHGIDEAIRYGLADQRMVGDLTLANKVLGTSKLVGKDRRD